MTKTLLMPFGLPQSGKSTWAIKQGYPIVCPDSIRLALHGQPFIPSAEPTVWASAKLWVPALFLSGHDTVVLDATNTTERSRKEWLDERWECKYILFPAPLEVCIERAIAADKLYLIPVIERMARNFEMPREYVSMPSA